MFYNKDMAINTRRSLYYIFQKKVLNTQTENYTVTYEEVCRDSRTIGTTTITQGIDSVPTVKMSIPIDSLPVDDRGIIVTNLCNYRVLLQIKENNKPKYGLACIVDSIKVEYATGVVELNLSHRMAEMRDWLMPINLAIKNMPLGFCVENVCRLGFPDDYVKDDQVLVDINYLTNASPENKDWTVAKDWRIDKPTNHVQQNLSGTSTANLIYVDQEIPVVIDMDEESYNKKLEMTFAANNKLSALGEIIDNTDNVHFIGAISEHELYYPPTSGTFGDGVKISTFSEECDDTILIAQNVDPATDAECDENDTDLKVIPMLSDPELSNDYGEHFNRAVVFCGDVGDGVLHLTLKELYERRDLQAEMGVDGNGDPLFPIGRYDYNVNLQPEAQYDSNGTKINNEKIYENNEMPEIAKNENREYYVTDREQLAKDNGLVKHTTYNFNDLYPIPALERTDTTYDSNMNPTTTKVELEITNEDRLEITKRAYWRAVRYLKSQRTQEVYSFNTGALPNTDLVGKRVRFRYMSKVTYPYDTELHSDDANCDESRTQMVVAIDDCFYITERIISFDEELNEWATVTLDKELRPNPVESLTIDIHEKSKGDNTEAGEMGKIYPEFGRVDYDPSTGTPEYGAESLKTPKATDLNAVKVLTGGH